MNDRQRRSALNACWLAFAACAAASAIPFLVTYRMPMNDLPQHAAQITLWKHDAHRGAWCLYAKRNAAPHRDCPAFEPDDAEGRSQ